MNQERKLRNGKEKFNNQAVIGNPNGNLIHKTFGKIRLSQTYLFREQINNELLKNLPASQPENYFASMELVYLDRHENIYKPDDFIHYIYFPESAVVSEFQILEDGKTVEVAMTGCEGLIGINAVFNARPSQNWSQVLIPGKALRINCESFRKKLDDCAAFQRRIYQFVNLYIAQISQRVVCNNYHTVEERLCCWLLMVKDRCDCESLPLTQEQIARFLGVHRPSITLITQSLRDKGAIDYVRGKISILDEQKLKNLSCICYPAA